MENEQIIEQNKDKKTKLRKILMIPEIIIIVFLFIIAILTITSSKNNGMPRDPIFGYSFLAVKSDSMKGSGKDNFQTGDLVIARKVKDVKDLKEGQIITFIDFDGEGSFLNSHRIVEITEDGTIYTQGDNHEMSFAKEVTNPKDILAVYQGQIKKVGKFFLFFEDRTNYTIFILVPLLILFLWNIYGFMKALFDYKRKSMISKAMESGEISEELKELAIQEYLAKQKAIAEANNAETTEVKAEDDSQVKQEEIKEPEENNENKEDAE